MKALRTREDFLIVALDFSHPEQAIQLTEQLGSRVHFYKVGMQLFFAAGETILKHLNKINKKIFIDLKLNDIPATVEKACSELQRYQPQMLTVFGDGSTVRAARAGIHPDCRVLNVTVLTSEDSKVNLANLVLERTKITLENGGDGVVCSGQETALLRRQYGEDFLIVNPGIRPLGSSMDDQSRVVTPRAAWDAGATHIVVGRPITAVANPVMATEKILQELG